MARGFCVYRVGADIFACLSYNRYMKEYIATIAFFDQFDYPLTRVELERWQLLDAALPYAVSSHMEQNIETNQGFYFLQGNNHIVQSRKNRYIHADSKYRKACAFARMIKFVPFIRLLAVCNTLAYNNARRDSDIDVFIVVEKNRLWLSRFVITVIAQLTRMRRHGKKITDRVCLSFYVTTDQLDFESITNKPHDPYFLFWMLQLVPILDINGTFETFIHANVWLRRYVAHPQSMVPSSQRSVPDSFASKKIRGFFEKVLFGSLGDILNSLAKLFEQALIKQHKDSRAWDADTAVIVSDTMLKFHESDQREHYCEVWKKTLSQL